MYVPEADLFVVLGNWTDQHSVYKIAKDWATGKKSKLKMVLVLYKPSPSDRTQDQLHVRGNFTFLLNSQT